LIGAKVDNYFQRAIRHFAGQGDKALAFIQSQCANVSNEDKSHFHHAFTTLRIKENESATSFIKRFIFAKTEAESAGNAYTEHDLVSFVLTGLNCSKNPKYGTALQLYRLEHEHGKMSFTLEDVEKRSLPILTGVRDSSFPKGIITKINWVGNLTLLLMLPPNQLSATTAVRKITFLLIVHIPGFKKKIKYPSRPLLRVDPLQLPHPAPKILQLWYAPLELLTMYNILTRFTWNTTTTLGLPLS
jgi:hypothetical protein